jgi:hypothetical protein
MGSNLPEVGERVAYFTNSGTVPATVIVVHFWDLVDLELDDGTIVRCVRRILAMGLGESDAGRFERFVARRDD